MTTNLNTRDRYQTAVHEMRRTLAAEVERHVDFFIRNAPVNGTENDYRADFLDHVLTPVWSLYLALADQEIPSHGHRDNNLKHKMQIMNTLYGPKEKP